ncbi:MAG: immunity 53 family protein [Candidatus Sulfotelmatobacter sp.]
MSVSMLEKWYSSQCDGEWEHSYGIHIDTLDNPGWRIKIDLRHTRKQSFALERQKISRSENDWIVYWIEGQQFHIACGPLNFSEAAEIFVRWFDLESD